MQAGRALEANLLYKKNSLKFVQIDKGTLPHPHHFESHTFVTPSCVNRNSFYKKGICPPRLEKNYIKTLGSLIFLGGYDDWHQ
jgi:hypothetical protein